MEEAFASLQGCPSRNRNAVPARFSIYLLLESWNPSTFGQLSESEQVLALFQGITPRSSGFNTIDIGDAGGFSVFIIILMFIGRLRRNRGGIKINTLVVLIPATIQTFRGVVKSMPSSAK